MSLSEHPIHDNCARRPFNIHEYLAGRDAEAPKEASVFRVPFAHRVNNLIPFTLPVERNASEAA